MSASALAIRNAAEAYLCNFTRAINEPPTQVYVSERGPGCYVVRCSDGFKHPHQTDPSLREMALSATGLQGYLRSRFGPYVDVCLEPMPSTHSRPGDAVDLVIEREAGR